jgi:Ni2+-binding GTPase involved in maturation of urease and hydrogenase
MKRLRFFLLGGFLGAGKTTAVTRLARHYIGRGQRVGVVMNDQAQDLVDTLSLRAQGFSVEEVAGACFCCRFDDLVGRIRQLTDEERPDVIIAEPVGSCTDLVATVVQPLRDLYSTQFEIAPYPVLVKPARALRVLRNEGPGGLSPKAAYIFRKQLEEADAIVINHVDEAAPVLVNDLAQLLAKEFPGVPVLRLSAKTGQGFESLTKLLEQDGPYGRKILDIDYDTYAEGEAELGWLNASARADADKPFELDSLLLAAVSGLRASCREQEAEIAHLKVIGLADESFGVANVVSSSSEPELSLPSRQSVTHAEVAVNARVAIDPDTLEKQVRQVLAAVAQQHGARISVKSVQSFRPGRPQPTHRYALAR